MVDILENALNDEGLGSLARQRGARLYMLAVTACNVSLAMPSESLIGYLCNVSSASRTSPPRRPLRVSRHHRFSLIISILGCSIINLRLQRPLFQHL